MMSSPIERARLAEPLTALARLAMEPPSELTAEHIVRACAIVREALDAQDAYVVRAGDPHFVRVGSDGDPAAYEIKQKGYYLIWRRLAANSRIAGGGVRVADRVVEGGTRLEAGARPTHLVSLLPCSESQSELLIVRGPWPAGLTEDHVAFLPIARPLLATLVGNFLDAERGERQRRQIGLLADVAGAFGRAERVEGVLSDIATALATASGFDWVTIVLVDPAVERIVDRARSVGRFSETATAATFWDLAGQDEAMLSEARRLQRTGRPLLVSDVLNPSAGPQRDPAHRRYAEALRRLYERAHILSNAVFPIRFQDELLGVAFLTSRTRRAFDADEVAFLSALVAQAAAGIGGLRLQRELHQRRRQLQDLVGRLLAAHEEERRRVAYEIHDGAAQMITAAHQHLQAFAAHHRPRRPEARAELERVAELVQRAVRDTRRVVAGLRPTVLDDFGLAAALRLELDGLQADGWTVAYRETLGPERLPAGAEAALFRIAQEAIANARKHSGGTRLALTLTHTPGRVRMEVRDWGRGFDPEAVGGQRGPGEQVGLAGMRERAMLLGGRVQVESRPGRGTRVIVDIPLAAPAGATT